MRENSLATPCSPYAKERLSRLEMLGNVAPHHSQLIVALRLKSRVRIAEGRTAVVGGRLVRRRSTSRRRPPLGDRLLRVLQGPIRDELLEEEIFYALGC